MEEGEQRSGKLPEGLAEELARELAELRSGSGDLEQLKASKEDLKDDEKDLDPKPDGDVEAEEDAPVE